MFVLHALRGEKIFRSIRFILSVTLSTALLLNSQAIAADVIVNNPSATTHVITTIANSDDLVQITNSGTIHSRVGGGPISRSDIDLGNDASSFINQIQGELLADITMNHDDQTFTYNAGTFEGDVVGGSGASYNGKFLVNSNLRYYQEVQNVDQLNLGSSVTMSLLGSSTSSTANDIILGSGSELIVGSNATVASNNIDGSAADTGILSLHGGGIANTNQNIGATNRLARINLDSNSILWTHGTLNAQTVNVNDGMLYIAQDSDIDSIILNGDSSVKFLLLPTSDSVINLDADVTLADNSNTADIHLMNLYSLDPKTVRFNGNIGTADKKLHVLYLESNGGGMTADFTNSDAVYARSTVLYGVDGSVPEIILGSGIFDSQIELNSGLNNIGKVTIAQDHNLIASIGSDAARINTLDVNAGVNLGVANSIYFNNINNNSGSTFAISANDSGFLHSVHANNFANHGLLDLTAASGQLSANIVNHSGSTVDIGQNAIIIDGSATFSSGSKLSFDLVSPSNFGSIRSNTVQIEDGVLLNVDIENAHDFYQLQQSSYIVVESVDKDNSQINAISNSNIAINSQSTNEIGLLTIATRENNGNLVLDVVKADDDTPYDPRQSRVRDVIDLIGDQSSGKLLDLQNYLLLTRANQNDKIRAIESLIPKSGAAVSRNSFHISDSIFRSIYSRISSYKISKVIGNYKRYKTVDSLDREVKELDESSTAQSSLIYGNDFQFETEEDLSRNVWAQIIGSKASQDDEGGFDGYDSTLQGLVLGFDKKVNKRTLVGASFAIADSQIDASDNLTSTQSDIFQLSAYIEQEIDKNSYYNLIAAVSKGTNNSSRVMPVANNATATAKFNSYNYTLKGSLYHKILFGNGFDLVPELGLRYSLNQIDDYQEQGAGSLNQNVKTDNLQMFAGIIGVAAGFKKKINSMNLLFGKTGSFIVYPKIKLSYEHDFVQDIQTSVSNFQGHDLTFTTNSSQTDPSTLRISIGSEIFGSESLSFNVKYIHEIRDSFVSHSGIFETRFAF